jgi:hypothetical protein
MYFWMPLDVFLEGRRKGAVNHQKNSFFIVYKIIARMDRKSRDKYINPN